MTRRHSNGGLRKVCGCARRTWAKCDHPWHFNFKPKHGRPPADWLATPGRDGRPRDPATWPGYRFSLDAHFGREIRSKTEAEALADELRIAIRAGTFGATAPARDTLTVGQLLDTYKAEKLDGKPGGAPAYDVSRINGVRRQTLRLPTGESRPFEHWLVADVSAGALELLREALRPQRVVRDETTRQVVRVGGESAARRGLKLLREVFNWAIVKGYVDATPFKRSGQTVIKIAREQGRSRRLRPGEADRLLAACGPHLRAVVEAALETGMRKGEILSLQWADVHLDAREIRLTPAKTKTRTGRTIPISSRLAAVLELRRLDPAGEPHPATGYVFGNEIAQRVGDIQTAWNAACRRAGIPTAKQDTEGLHFHDLRREAGSRWLDAGVPLHTIRAWLGHANIAQTSTYLATTLATEHEHMRRFDERRGALQGIATEGGKGVHTGALSAETTHENTPESAGVH